LVDCFYQFVVIKDKNGMLQLLTVSYHKNGKSYQQDKTGRSIREQYPRQATLLEKKGPASCLPAL
jgi:hypothetical protein